MNTILNSALTLTYNQLSTFSGLDNFWQVFDTAFGTQYNRSGAEILRLQWLSGDFSQLPQVEILDSNILGGANGAYASSNNKIYLSANFLATSTAEAISAVLLEEIGHFIDAQINLSDSAGDEGEKFSALVQGQNLTTQELDRINTENDWANITVGGEQVAVEQNTPIVLTVTTTADQNDGSATGGLSLRDAILIANANTTNDYVIELQGGQTYSLSIKNTASLNNGGDEQAAVRGDLDILAGGKITIKSVGTQKAIIDATNLKTSFASGFGDAAIDVKENAYLILNGVTITGASVGAVWINPNSTAEISNSLITNNEITVASAFYESNQDGSGITNYGTLLLKDSTISNNKAARFGGGIYNNDTATATIINTTISGNTADQNAGGIFNFGMATITNTTISGNTADKAGGGIYNFGTATITNSTISGNKTNQFGGGIINTGTATITNTTISGNTANQYGGGIFSSNSTSATVTGKIYLNNSTITNNTADLDSNRDGSGGGITNVSGAGEVYAKNTIIAGNFDTPNNNSAALGAIYHPDINGSINGNNYNLIGNKTGSSGTIGTGTDLVNSNILLGTLQNNGGSTQTHALFDGSLAINAGNNSLISLDINDIDGDGNTTETIPFDQRGTGFSRIANNRVDIGAFEFQGIPSPFITINNISVSEGNSGTKTGTVTVNLNAVTDKTVTVNYTTANNNAIAGIDYTATSGQLSFAPGETTKTFNVNILGDNIAEANKSFFVNLSNPTNAIIDPNAGQGIVTITDDEPHPIILGGNSLPNPAITLTVNTTADQNDGTATNGLSLRDAILIANADTTNDYIINLTGGTTYSLTAFSLIDTKGGDLDILGKVTIQSTGTQPATIDASGLTNADRVFEVFNYLNLSNIVVKGGATTEDGGGIYIRSNATALLFNTTVKNNSSSSSYSSDGGGIYNDGVLALINSTVADNQVVGSYTDGGGIYNNGQAILLGTTIKNNTAWSGGGIESVGTLTISNSTIYNNTAVSFGGGIDSYSSTISLINSSVSGNKALYGGGIRVSNGTLNIFNSTITQNATTATGTYDGYVGGIDNSGASVNLKNSIVAGNIGGYPDLKGNINGNNNNLIGNLSGASGTVGTGTDIVNPNPKLGPLQDNGNGIFTHALLSGSPAINAGNNALVLTDVFDLDADGNNTETIPFDNRGSGYTRISGGTVDIGAFEFQPALNLSLSINDVTLTEGNSGTKNATFTVTLSGETFQPVTVNYATANGTATAGSDYTATTGTLIFNVNPGETSKQITVSILGDTLAESDETFFINLSNPINATIADNQGITTITNDDGSIGNTLPEVEGNNTFATAQVIANTSFNRQLVADIQDFNGSNISTTYDHVSILGTGDGTFDLYRFNALANTQLVFDIDNNNFDTILRLWNPNNNQLLSSNDDGIETGNTGNDAASFLTYKTLATSDYIIGVYRYSSSALTPPATGDSYTLHLSMLNDDVFTPIESAGNTKLVKDATNKYF
ncbi:Calx-beta domain-containing protein, partial [Dolichospermum sp. UHCC 0260]|uniref:beta strand repeat-containing protein n=2 Tax=unclassified Dolichospermum TaxID=2622029 RepID=UPI0016A2B38E